jgi:hypothetical protein
MSSPSLPPELDAPSLAAIFLGASKFDYFPQLDNPAFLASKDAFRAAFGNSNLSIFGNRIATLDLFDRPDNPIEAIRQIRGFLEANHHCSDIFLYYCGHGHFLADSTFVLMLRSTENGLEYTTGLQSSILKNPFEKHRGNKRLFIILDCCYAGEVTRSWMSSDAQPRITR